MVCTIIIIYLHKFKNVVNFRISLLASLNKILKEFTLFNFFKSCFSLSSNSFCNFMSSLIMAVLKHNTRKTTIRIHVNLKVYLPFILRLMNNQTVCRRHYNNGNLEGMKALRLVLNITDSPGIKLEGSLCLTSLTLSFSFPRSF